jgi:hypothetical protein
MWPGQQPPGGEQNPQSNNPYQQPGYQQPNPYQQPGYQQQPGTYGQQQWGAPQQPGAPQPVTPPGGLPPVQPGGGGGGNNRTKLVAIVAASAVVLTAAVTGFLVLGGDGDKEDTAGGGGKKDKASQSPTQSSDPSPTQSGSDDNPRGDETIKPTIEGWKVVFNPKWGVAFDVPGDWEVQSPTLSIGFEDDKSEDGKPLIMMSAPAYYKSKWCSTDENKDGRSEDSHLAAVGTKGADGAKSTDEVAVNQVPWWVYGGYTQPDKKSITFDKKAKPYTTTSGITGSLAWAQSTNTPQKGKCASDGKAVTFGFKNADGAFVAWNLYGAKGVKGEVPKETILKILSTVRLHGDATES